MLPGTKLLEKLISFYENTKRHIPKANNFQQ